ncbi:hypothetical protein AB4Y32_25305 [Paraburkholderia phymatum]|uniref:Uncharacterized protein n=1 Tax=Paraburkholderia phymatum TaxID=148447 RepID=A0ACC6U681_9BURK
MEDLYYKGVRVAPSSTLGVLLTHLHETGPKLTEATRADIRRRIEAIFQECEREYHQWGNR